MGIVIIGAGALGGFFGGQLVAAGEDVTFVARGQTLEALQRNGLRLTSPQLGELDIPVKAVESATGLPPADLVFLSVKAYDLDNAARSALPVVQRGTTVLAVQNGIDHPQRLAAILPGEAILPAVVLVSATVSEPGVVAHVGGPGLIQIGEMSPGISERVSTIVSRFQAAGIRAEAHEDIRPLLWKKFAMICAFSGVTALTRLKLAQVFAHPDSRAFFHDVMIEVLQVARASGATVPDSFAADSIAMVEAMPVMPEYGSMAYDLFAGKRLEIETLNGTVARLGREYGVPTPLNRAIFASLAPYASGRTGETG